jgi:hypothetical protein
MTDQPSLLGPITDQDVTRWQNRGARALTDLLAEAFREKLPPLVWRLGSGSSLHGTADSPTLDPAGRRAAFDRWARHLAAVVWPETTDPAGGTRLRARVDDYHGVHVTIAADLYDSDPS